MHFLRRPFSFPQELETALCRALWGRESPPENELKRLGKDLETLWPKLAVDKGEQKKDERHYAHLRDFCKVYASYYFPANAMKAALVLEESFSLGVDLLGGEGGSWVDIGCGPGTLLGGLSWWAYHRGKDLRYTGLDHSGDFLRIAQQFHHHLAAKTPGSRAAFHQVSGHKEILERVHKEKPKIISLSNSLHELAPDPARKAEFVKKLLASVSRNGGYLLLLEPASRANSRELLELREQLLDSAGTRILLPCTDNRPCGALAKETDWCHEEAAMEFPGWHERLGMLAGLKKEALLFSYLLIAAGEATVPSLTRIVSQRLEQKGQMECYLCAPEGKRKVRLQYSKTTPETEGFLSCARGQLFSRIHADERHNVTGFTEFPYTADPLLEKIFPL